MASVSSRLILPAPDPGVPVDLAHAGIGLAVFRVDGDRLAERGQRHGEVLRRLEDQRRLSAPEGLIGRDARGLAGEHAAALGLADLDRQRADDVLDHVVLELEDVGDRPGIALRPGVLPLAAVDQPDIDAQILRHLPDRAFEHVADGELVGDGERRDVAAPVAVDGIGGEHRQLAELGQVGDQVVEDAVDDQRRLFLAAEVGEGEDGDRIVAGRRGGDAEQRRPLPGIAGRKQPPRAGRGDGDGQHRGAGERHPAR